MDLQAFFDSQIELWHGQGTLPKVETRNLKVSKYSVTLQHNPARIISTGAKIDAATIKQRPCFLCPDNRLNGQQSLAIEAAGQTFDILVNPYPILPYHFTIACHEHHKQRIVENISAITTLIDLDHRLTVFYNGPLSGASAPDHLHFQAALYQDLPLQRQWRQIIDDTWQPRVSGFDRGEIAICHYISPFFAIETNSPERFILLINKVVTSLPIKGNDPEARINIIAWHADEMYHAAIIPRNSHRPQCYFMADKSQILVSPGALDMAGLIITPRHDDFMHICANDIEQIMSECGAAAPYPIEIGITHKKNVNVTFNGDYQCGREQISGQQVIKTSCGQLDWNGQIHKELQFVPCSSEATFTIDGVEIGRGFHWERDLRQTFRGSLRVCCYNDEVCIVNLIDTETYLTSVIASEMSPTSPTEFLKAHAIISRSWVMAQVAQRTKQGISASSHGYDKPHTHIRWYDHDAHSLFDVCADDHCQRYQGVPNKAVERAVEAVRATQGMLLTNETSICDARFSKCCGGITERFSACWSDEDKDYLPVKLDDTNPGIKFRPIHSEEMATEWIENKALTFCGRATKETLRQSLKGFDQETPDFYRWSVRIEQEPLRQQILRQTGFDGGNILSLVPILRGESGRIIILRIIAKNDYIDIGKELEIRRALSPKCLLSSAFVVKAEYADGSTKDCNDHIPSTTDSQQPQDVPTAFILNGAGWGHGVGLCQIGAVQMAAEGYDYKQILQHYYQCDIAQI